MEYSYFNNGYHRIAYSKQEGASPTVMFLSGFRSDMAGAKATALALHCAARGQAFLRFDYSGHGQSGGDFMQGSIGQWLDDALVMFDQLTEGKVLLVGSSMGGWLALLIALARPERIHALIGIATAPDFTERLIWETLDDAQKKELRENGVFYAPSCYGEEPYPITLTLIEEGRRHLLLTPSPAGGGLGWGLACTESSELLCKPAPLPASPLRVEGVSCPIHLLHGTDDRDVPVAIAHLLKQKIPHAVLNLIEGGDHRLSDKPHLQRLCDTLDHLL